MPSKENTAQISVSLLAIIFNQFVKSHILKT